MTSNVGSGMIRQIPLGLFQPVQRQLEAGARASRSVCSTSCARPSGPSSEQGRRGHRVRPARTGRSSSRSSICCSGASRAACRGAGHAPRGHRGRQGAHRRRGLSTSRWARRAVAARHSAPGREPALQASCCAGNVHAGDTIHGRSPGRTVRWSSAGPKIAPGRTVRHRRPTEGRPGSVPALPGPGGLAL